MPRPSSSADVLTHRTLNRTLLDRQSLLARRRTPVEDLLTELVGLQAQEPRDPYVALWSRIEDFDPASLEELLVERRAVRIVLLRGTVHLVTADDCCRFRTLVQPILDRELTIHSEHKAVLAGLDLGPVLRLVKPFLAEAPRTPADMRRHIAEHLPEAPAAAAAYAMRNHLPLVQVPPRGLWATSGTVRLTTADAWLGRSVDPEPSLDALVLRYLTAFGPALPGDFTAWSGLQGAKELFERLRPDLRVFRDEKGRELFDVPDGRFAEPDTPAPVRFLPCYDNVVLAHRDRTRVVPDGLRAVSLGPVDAGLLVDGFFAGLWQSALDEGTGTAVLTVSLGRAIARGDRAPLEAEARRLARFRHPTATAVEVRVHDPQG